MKRKRASKIQSQTWKTSSGKPLSCREKIKTLNQNMDEIHEVCQDAFEDALLMDCDDAQFRSAIHKVIDNLTTPYLSLIHI